MWNKELGIPRPTLHEWVNKAKSSGHCVTQGDGDIKNADIGKLIDENKELRKCLSRLEQEKEILKRLPRTLQRSWGEVRFSLKNTASNFQ